VIEIIGWGGKVGFEAHTKSRQTFACCVIIGFSGL